MDKHVDHRWGDSLQVHCHLGPPGNVRCYEVFGEDPLAVATTAHLCALSIQSHGGRFTVGPLWWKRIDENAAEIERMHDALDDPEND